jgi:SNF2 family DNA or RNA helicase
MRRPFRKYQRAGFKYTLLRNASALYMEMRLGKTLVTIRSVDYKQAYPALIVGPYSTHYGWKNDLQLEGLTDLVSLTGTVQQRTQALLDGVTNGARWFIINKEGHLWLQEINLVNWATIIIDESTFIKNPQAKVTKFFTKNDVFVQAPNKYILSGTPAPDGLLDYYMQLQFLNPDWLGCESYWEFRNKYFICDRYNWKPTKKGATLMERTLADQCFFKTRKEAGLGGEKIYATRTIQMPTKVRKAYTTAVEEFVYEYGTDYNKTIWATNRWTWLRKLMGGFYGDRMVWDGKYCELLYLLMGELKNQPVVIWCNYLNELEALHTKLKNRYKGKAAAIHGAVSQPQREAYLKAFNTGKLRYMVMQSSINMGFDLSAADTAIFYSTPTKQNRQQAEDRLIAAGKIKSSLIIDLAVEDSIEIDILQGIKQGQTESEIHAKIIKRFKAERGLL